MPTILSPMATAYSLSALLGAGQNASNYGSRELSSRLCVAEHLLGMEFFVSSPPALQVIDTALRKWQFLFGWPACSPSFRHSWNWGGLTLPNTNRLLSLSGRMRCLRMIGALSLRLSSTPYFRCLSLGLRAVFPFANLCAPMKWCTDFLVRRTLVFGVWPVGAMILFLGSRCSTLGATILMLFL